MKGAATFVLAALIAASAPGRTTYYTLELKGGTRLFSRDRPVRKGRFLLFHRHPDGTYMSLAADEVEKVVSTEEAPKPERFAPGETVFIGPAVEGPRFETPQTAAATPADASGGSGYGYSGWYSGGYVPAPRPPLAPPPSPPTRVGPNGFPILAPPGGPGPVPPPIGANGFPILSSQPAPAPRQR